MMQLSRISPPGICDGLALELNNITYLLNSDVALDVIGHLSTLFSFNHAESLKSKVSNKVTPLRSKLWNRLRTAIKGTDLLPSSC